jgi:hypothetical protein
MTARLAACSATPATTVVSHPARFWISPGLEPLSRSQASCHGVAGLVRRDQQPIGERPQAAPVLLESLRKPVLLAHPVTSSLGRVTGETRQDRPM